MKRGRETYDGGAALVERRLSLDVGSDMGLTSAMVHRSLIALALALGAPGCGVAPVMAPPPDLAPRRVIDLAIPPDLGSLPFFTPDIGDLPPDFATPGPLVYTITIDTLFDDCLPPTPADPLHISGTLQLTNSDKTATFGPIAIVSGRLTDGGAQSFGSFAIQPITIPALVPGASDTETFTKTAGSFVGASCTQAVCAGAVVVELELSGPGLPTGTAFPSQPMPMTCAF
jgi:hypothetical protein